MSNQNRTFRLKIAHKLFHNDLPPSLGTITATLTPKGGVRFGKANFTADIEAVSDFAIARHRDVMKKHVKDAAQDMRYPILWNEETGWETHVIETTP